MAPPNLESDDDASRLVAEANKILARLQSERLREMSITCMRAYGPLVPKSDREVWHSPFALHPMFAPLLAGSLDWIDYTDSESAEEVDRVVESFARQLRLDRKRVQNDFDVFLCHNSFGWVDYRTLDPDPLEQLIWGVSGRRSPL